MKSTDIQIFQTDYASTENACVSSVSDVTGNSEIACCTVEVVFNINGAAVYLTIDCNCSQDSTMTAREEPAVILPVVML